MRIITRRNKALAVASSVILAAILTTNFASLAQGGSADPRLQRKLARLRTVTATFHNEALAVAGGYQPTDHCVASPEGGMGYHYAHPDRIQDDVIDRDKPELLLYGPTTGSERKLVAVEYFKADADQDLSTDDDRPTLFGQPFNGPMPGHEPGMPVHYDLHVWVWRGNPEGIFSPFNTRVTCSS